MANIKLKLDDCILLLRIIPLYGKSPTASGLALVVLAPHFLIFKVQYFSYEMTGPRNRHRSSI